MEEEILNPETPEVEAEVVGESTAPEATVEGEIAEAPATSDDAGLPEAEGVAEVEGEEVATEEVSEEASAE